MVTKCTISLNINKLYILSTGSKYVFRFDSQNKQITVGSALYEVDGQMNFLR
jgi:hypothetical protein